MFNVTGASDGISIFTLGPTNHEVAVVGRRQLGTVVDSVQIDFNMLLDKIKLVKEIEQNTRWNEQPPLFQSRQEKAND